MKKFISILLTLAMAISVCSNVVLAADTQATIVDKTETAMKMATADNLIYIDDNMDNDPTSVEAGKEGLIYSTRHLLGTGAADYRFVGISYPPALKTANKVLSASNQAVVDTVANTIKSNVSGVTYTLPNKKSSSGYTAGQYLNNLEFEGYVLDRGGWAGGAQNAQGHREYTLPTADNYDKIHVLIATTKSTYVQSSSDAVVKEGEYSTVGWSYAGAFWAIPKYSDGSTGLPTDTTTYKTTGIVDASKEPYMFTTAFLNSDAANGSQGMLGRIIPTDANITDENRHGFVAELEARFSNDIYPSTKSNINSSDTTKNSLGSKRFTADFSNAEANAAHSIILYEYTIDVDETRTLSSIHFGNQASKNKQGIAVLSVVGEKAGTIPTPFYKDMTSLNTGKVYIDADDTDETQEVLYKKTDFIGRNQNTADHYVAIKWPIKEVTQKSYSLANTTYGTFSVKDPNGTPDNTKDDVSVVASATSGITYELTRDGAATGAKDAIILDADRKGDGHNIPTEVEIPVNNAPYEKIGVLFAAANQSSKDGEKIKVYAKYTDGTTSADEAKSATNGGAYYYATAPNHQYMKMYTGGTGTMMGEVQAMGFNGGVGHVPIDDKGNESPFTFTNSEYTNTDTSNTKYMSNVPTAYLYEITLGQLDTTKAVESVVVEILREGDWTSSVSGFAVLGVAGLQTVVAKPANVAENAVAVEAYTKTAGDVYAAVYEKGTKKLVAMGLAKNVAANALTDVAVDNDAIVAGGEYDIKLFVWATDGSFAPLAGATDIH